LQASETYDVIVEVDNFDEKMPEYKYNLIVYGIENVKIQNKGYISEETRNKHFEDYLRQ
jgi:hypothetical protein